MLSSLVFLDNYTQSRLLQLQWEYVPNGFVCLLRTAGKLGHALDKGRLVFPYTIPCEWHLICKEMHPVFSQLLVLHLISYSIAEELISLVGKVSYVSTAPPVINTRWIEPIKVDFSLFQLKQNFNFSYNILSFRNRK